MNNCVHAFRKKDFMLRGKKLATGGRKSHKTGKSLFTFALDWLHLCELVTYFIFLKSSNSLLSQLGVAAWQGESRGVPMAVDRRTLSSTMRGRECRGGTGDCGLRQAQPRAFCRARS